MTDISEHLKRCKPGFRRKYPHAAWECDKVFQELNKPKEGVSLGDLEWVGLNQKIGDNT